MSIDHPALVYLVDGPGFSWPTTAVDTAYVSRFLGGADVDREDLGLLGAPGLSTAAALSWGRPHTSRRLKRMACTIAWLARSRRIRVDADYSVAVAQWESDLDYLRSKCYGQRHDFDWPNARVY
jgi:hypothetical protein